jgi:hypothetical protein
MPEDSFGHMRLFLRMALSRTLRVIKDTNLRKRYIALCTDDNKRYIPLSTDDNKRDKTKLRDAYKCIRINENKSII